LGTKGHTKEQSSQLMNLFAKSTAHDEVVLIVPSLDLRLEGEGGDRTSNMVLPEVGQHLATTTAATTTTEEPTTITQDTPNMAASVLSLAKAADNSLNNKALIEQKAADSIGQKTSWTRSTVVYAAQAVASNLSDSFTTLLNSRLRAWTLLLLRHSLSTQNAQARSRLLNMLSAKIAVQHSETTYRTLPLPESAAGAKPKDADIILPLLFEVLLHLSIQGKDETVTLRAPGTVTGALLRTSFYCSDREFWNVGGKTENPLTLSSS